MNRICTERMCSSFDSRIEEGSTKILEVSRYTHISNTADKILQKQIWKLMMMMKRLIKKT